MAELISPSVNLLIYDLRNELGQTLEDIQENRDLFSKKIPQNAPPLAWKKDNLYDAEFVELLGERKQVGTLPLAHRDYQGYYYPVRIQDVYGLLLNCTVKDRSLPYSPARPSQIKGILEQISQKQTGTLGQTWIISACAESITQTQTLALARECYQIFFKNENWDDNLIESNRFLGGALFELENYDLTIPENLEASAWDAWIAEKQTKNHHVLIAIYPDLEMLTAANYFITDWMRIFCYRHKALWNSMQARLFKQLLESDFVKVQKYIDFPGFRLKYPQKANLQQRQNQLKTMLLDYSIDLSFFKGKLNAIANDLHRYNQQANSMKETLASENLQNNVIFLGKFAQDFKNNHLFLLQNDDEILSSGLNLLNTAINLLQGELEVQKIQRDRAFQKRALAVGTGLGCGIATAAIASHWPPTDEQQLESALATPVGQLMSQTLSVPPQWVIPATTGTLSLTVAIVVAIGVRLLLALER